MRSRPFRRTRAGVQVNLGPDERALLADLLDEVDTLLGDDEAERALPPADLPAGDPLAALDAQLSAPPPADPAVARLLPDGHRDDPELAAGYRRLTEDGLRARKRAGLSRAARALLRPDPVVLDRADAAALLKGLTDIRLVLAERLGLHTDEDAERLHRELARAADSEVTEGLLASSLLYDALTWWQEELVTAIR